MSADDPNANYAFLKHELDGKYKGTISALKKTSTLEEAAASVEKTYEGADPRYVNMANRNKMGQQALALTNDQEKQQQVAAALQPKETEALKGVQMAAKSAKDAMDQRTASQSIEANQNVPSSPPSTDSGDKKSDTTYPQDRAGNVAPPSQELAQLFLGHSGHA
jgi:hypothetical protein